MSQSPRMNWPYPAEGADPWYSAFEGMVTAQDASVIALEEAKNIILTGGGSVSWDASVGGLYWTDPIVLNSANTGYVETIAGPGVVSVSEDGLYGYVRFVTMPSSSIGVELLVAAVIPETDLDSAFVIFRRKGSKLYFRNGAVLANGQTQTIFEGASGVSSVAADAPLASTGGSAPVISLSGQVSVAKGGTGLSAGISGGVPYFSSTSAMQSSAVLESNRLVLGGGAGGAPQTNVAPGSAGWVLTSAGIGNPPVFQSVSGLVVDATSGVKGVVRLAGGLSGTSSSAETPILNVNTGNVTGSLPLNNGGTGGPLTAVSGAVAYSTGVKIQLTAAGTSGAPLISKGTSAPVFEALNLASAVAVTGTLPTANQAAQSMAGDVTGTTAAATVAKLRGTALAATLSPSAGQVLAWSGSAWQPATMSGGGGSGGGGTYYLNYSVSVPSSSFKQMSLIYSEGVETTTGNITLNTSTPTTIASFVTDADEPAVSYIPPGNWELALYAGASTTSTQFRFVVQRVDNALTPISTIATSDYVPVTIPGSSSMYTASLYVPATNLDLTDRVAIIIEAISTSGTPTIAAFFEGNKVSHLHTTLGIVGGTGLLKVVNGYPQSPASLLTDGDIATGVIGVNKLNATSTAGYVLKTDGTTASWGPAASSGVTSLTVGDGLTPTGTITSTGSIAVNLTTSGGTNGTSVTVPRQDDKRFNPNPTGVAVGSVTYNDGTAWVSAGAGSAGTVLTAKGVGLPPTWDPPSAVFTGAGIGAYRAPSSSPVTISAVTDYLIDLTGATNWVVNLPAATIGIQGRIFVIKLSGTGGATINPNAPSQTIDGAASLYVYTQYMSYTLMCTGTTWIII